jgi:hypothetical protein
MGREMNYSATLAAYGLASYICYRNIIYLSQSLNMLLKFGVICYRASEILEMDERYDYNDTSMDASSEEYSIECNNVNATWGFQIQQDIYSGDVEVLYNPIINLHNISFTAK